MDEKLVHVGDVAERLGVSRRTIKYYEELGLIEPEERSEGGFRRYGPVAVRRLEIILRLKGIGFSLSAIREILEIRDTAQEATKETVLGETIEHLEEQRAEVESRAGRLREDLKRAEDLYRDLGRDIELCKKRIEQLGDQSNTKVSGPG